MAVPQDQIVANANQVFSILRELTNTLATVNELVNTYGELNGANVLGAMATCPLNADGSLGPTDPTPSTADGHVIDTSIVTTLSIALSAYDIGVMINLLQELQNLLNGVAVTTLAAAPNMLAKASSGGAP